MQQLKNWVFLILCNLIWASQFALLKIVLMEIPGTGDAPPEMMGPVFATFFPMTLATLILIPIVRWQHKADAGNAGERAGGRMPRRDIFDFLLIGVLGQVVAQLFITWSQEYTSASNASLLQLTLPITTSVMAYFLLSERMTWLRAVSFVLAIAGVLVTSFSAPAGSTASINWQELDFANSKPLLGNLLVFLGVSGSAFYNVYSKNLLKRYSPLEVLLYSYYAVFLFMLPITLWCEPQGFAILLHFSLKQWIAMGTLAVFQYAVSMVIFLRVLTNIDAMQAALMNYLLPFLGVLIAWVLLGETVTFYMVFGGLLALGSTLMATMFDKPQDTDAVATADSSG